MDTSNFKEVFTSDEVKQLRQRVAVLESQLRDVRKAERERVAQYVQQGTGDWMLGKKIAKAIRAMGDE